MLPHWKLMMTKHDCPLEAEHESLHFAVQGASIVQPAELVLMIRDGMEKADGEGRSIEGTHPCDRR